MSSESAPQAEARARAVRPAGRAVDVCFAAVPEAARAARSAVVDALTGHAGLGAGDLVRVGVAVSEDVVRLEVEDPGHTGTIAARNPNADRGGFGLRLVEALAQAWGVSRDGHSRVWVELICWPATRSLQA